MRGLLKNPIFIAWQVIFLCGFGAALLSAFWVTTDVRSVFIPVTERVEHVTVCRIA